MNLSEILALPEGSPFGPQPFLVVDNKPAVTKAEKKYLLLTISDSTASTTSPIWNDVPKRTDIKKGDFVEISGTIDSYNGKPQLKFGSIRVVQENLSISDFVPSYQISEKQIDLMLNTIHGLADPWNGILYEAFDLIEGCTSDQGGEMWQKFLQCPAAKSHHGNRIGGLFLHTLGVLKIIGRIKMLFPDIVTLGLVDMDRLQFLAIFHDYGKMYEYEWETGVGYRDDACVDHRVTGPVFFQKFCQDADEVNLRAGRGLIGPPWAERQLVFRSLASHHGFYGEKQPVTLEDHLLFLADMVEVKIQEALDGVS